MQITCDTLWWYSERGNKLFFHTPGDSTQMGYIQCYRPGRRIVSNGIRYRPDLVIPANIRKITMREAQELFPDFPLFQHGPQPQVQQALGRTATEMAMTARLASMQNQIYEQYIANRYKYLAPSLADLAGAMQSKPAPTPKHEQPQHADALPYRTG